MTLEHAIHQMTQVPAERADITDRGVLADGKPAACLVSSDATATGDGKCLPTPENCERVEMKAGETEFFDVMEHETGVSVTRAWGPRQPVETVANAIARALERPTAEIYPHAVSRLLVILNEEWEHRLYAERDLDALETSGSGTSS